MQNDHLQSTKKLSTGTGMQSLIRMIRARHNQKMITQKSSQPSYLEDKNDKEKDSGV